MKKNILLLLSLVAFSGSASAMEKVSTTELFEKFYACNKKHTADLSKEYAYCDSFTWHDSEEIADCKSNARKELRQKLASEGCSAIKEELVARMEKEKSEHDKCEAQNIKLFNQIDNICKPLDDRDERANCRVKVHLFKQDLCHKFALLAYKCNKKAKGHE